MSDDNAKPTNPFISRGFIAAAVVVGAVALAAVVILVTSLTAARNPATQPPAPTNDPAVTVGDESACGLTGFETESDLTAPPKTNWQLVGTVAAPTDPEGSGPGRIDSDGFRTCFSHTSAGALFAAINYIALGSDRRNADRMVELFVPGPGVDVALTAEGEKGTSVRLQVAGFKVNSYSADEAVIDVVWSVTSSGNSLVSFPTVLKWDKGDWKIVLNDDGQPPFTPSPLQSLGGYIPWSGV